MKKLFIVTLVILTVVLAAQVAFGQEETMGPLKGKSEVSLGGSIMIDPINSWSLTGSYGRFTTDNLEVGIGGTLSKVQGLDTAGSASVFGKYHFVNVEAPSRTVPYLGLLVGERFAGGNTDTIWGGSAGVKFFTSEERAFFVEYDYYKATGHGGGHASMIVFGVSTLY